MEKKNLFDVLCPYKLSAKDIFIAVWFCISTAMLTIADDASLLCIILVCANFAVSSYFLSRIKIKTRNHDDDE